jgi:hypothetical protein
LRLLLSGDLLKCLIAVLPFLVAADMRIAPSASDVVTIQPIRFALSGRWIRGLLLNGLTT